MEIPSRLFPGSLRLSLSHSAVASSRRQLWLYGGLLGILTVLALAGLVLAARNARRESELAQLKVEFVSNVSHELKTPLALIRMFGEMLQLGYVKNEAQAKDYSGIITKEAERLTLLINNVLDFSSLEADGREFHFYPEEIGAIARTTTEAYGYLLKEHGFDLTIETAPGLPAAVVDKDAISQALLNLLNNAFKYSGEGKRIDVRVFGNNGEPAIEVRDYGLGIDQAELPHIFEKFYRGRDDAVRKERGTGLGLALVKRIMDKHGGRVEVESEKGKGSAFRLILPTPKGSPS